MSKYKQGDLVLVRHDLEINKKYGGLAWLSHMQEQLSGKIFNLERVSLYGTVDINGWHLTSEMIQRKVGRIEYALRRIFARRTIK